MAHGHKHDIDATADHEGVSGAVEGNLFAFDANGLPKDSGLASASVLEVGGAGTITALWTFNRNPAAPFGVSSGSAVVTNLDADKVDGYHASAFPRKAENAAITGAWTHNANLLLSGTNQLHLGDGDTRILQESDGHLGYVADGYHHFTGVIHIEEISTLHAAGSTLMVGSNAPVNGREISIQTSSDAVRRSGITFIRTRGSVGSETINVDGDSVGFCGFKGYDGTNTELSALLEAFIDGAPASGAVPIRLSFVTGTSAATREERLVIHANGRIVINDRLGIGTAAIPHGGVGSALVAIEGANASVADGPHMQFTASSGGGDDYPVIQIWPWRHDHLGINLDCYYDGEHRASDAGSSYAIRKADDQLQFKYGVAAAGAVVTLNNAAFFDTSGDFNLNQNLNMADGKALGIKDNERFIWDAGGIITVSGAHLLLDGTNEVRFGDDGTKIYQGANSFLNIVADGAVRLTTTGTVDLTVPANYVLEVTGSMFLIDSGFNPRLVLGDSTSANMWGSIRWVSASDAIGIGTDTGGVDTLLVFEDGNARIAGAGEWQFGSENEKIYRGAVGYLDYAAPTAHRFETDLLYVDAANGRVGVGTAAPGTLFHVFSNVSGGTTLTVESNYTDNTAFAHLVLDGSVAAPNACARVLFYNDGSPQGIIQQNAGGGMYFANASLYSFSAEIQFPSARVSGSGQIEFGGADEKIYRGAVGYLDIQSPTATRFNSIIDLVATTSTAGQITQGGTRLFHTYGTDSVFVGEGAGNFTLTGNSNVGIGRNALDGLTSAWANVAVGDRTLSGVVGSFNTAVGYRALQVCTGTNNVAMGASALSGLLGGVGNVAVGVAAGATGTGAHYGVFLGFQAGRYETSGYRLFIDNDARANEADARVKALVYGIFAAVTANQLLRINGALEVREDSTMIAAAKLQYRDDAVHTSSVDDGYMDHIADLGVRFGGTTSTQKLMVTPLGGIAIRLTNQTGGNTVLGEIVQADTGSDDAVELCNSNGNDAMGIIYEEGIANGEECWVVKEGIADVALENETASVHGNWAGMSATAGRADMTGLSPPAAPAHFQEVGHCIETKVAGAPGVKVLARMVVHFN